MTARATEIRALSKKIPVFISYKAMFSGCCVVGGGGWKAAASPNIRHGQTLLEKIVSLCFVVGG